MGIERKTTSWRPSDETRLQLKALQAFLAPLAVTVSDTLRIVIDLVFRWFFTPGTLQGMIETLQGLLRNAPHCGTGPTQLELSFPPHPPEVTFYPRIFPPKCLPRDSFERKGAA
jgi:hypothetical protein